MRLSDERYVELCELLGETLQFPSGVTREERRAFVRRWLVDNSTKLRRLALAFRAYREANDCGEVIKVKIDESLS